MLSIQSNVACRYHDKPIPTFLFYRNYYFLLQRRYPITRRHLLTPSLSFKIIAFPSLSFLPSPISFPIHPTPLCLFLPNSPSKFHPYSILLLFQTVVERNPKFMLSPVADGHRIPTHNLEFPSIRLPF